MKHKTILLILALLLISGCAKYSEKECEEIARTDYNFDNPVCDTFLYSYNNNDCGCFDYVDHGNSLVKDSESYIGFQIK